MGLPVPRAEVLPAAPHSSAVCLNPWLLGPELWLFPSAWLVPRVVTCLSPRSFPLWTSLSGRVVGILSCPRGEPCLLGPGVCSAPVAPATAGRRRRLQLVSVLGGHPNAPLGTGSCSRLSASSWEGIEAFLGSFLVVWLGIFSALFLVIQTNKL